MIFHECQFLADEPTGREFCGKETVDLGPWCQAHLERVYHQKGSTVWDRENGPAVHHSGKRHFQGKRNYRKK